MPTSNERKMLSSNEALKELKGRICHFVEWQIPPFNNKVTKCTQRSFEHIEVLYV